MNIEQIAHETWAEVCKSSSVGQSVAVAFAKALLSKLAEQDVEPVAEVLERNRRANDGDIWTERYVKWINTAKRGEKLYTKTQLISAQQRTAEACAKVCESICAAASSNPPALCAMTIRNKWMEYL